MQLFTYVLAELPRRSRRRIRTAGDRVIVMGHTHAHIWTAVGASADAHPVIIPLPVETNLTAR